MKIFGQFSISLALTLALFYATGCHESLADVISGEQVYVPSTWEFDWFTEDGAVR